MFHLPSTQWVIEWLTGGGLPFLIPFFQKLGRGGSFPSLVDMNAYLACNKALAAFRYLAPLSTKVTFTSCSSVSTCISSSLFLICCRLLNSSFLRLLSVALLQALLRPATVLLTIWSIFLSLESFSSSATWVACSSFCCHFSSASFALASFCFFSSSFFCPLAFLLNSFCSFLLTGL